MGLQQTPMLSLRTQAGRTLEPWPLRPRPTSAIPSRDGSQPPSTIFWFGMATQRSGSIAGGMTRRTRRLAAELPPLGEWRLRSVWNLLRAAYAASEDAAKRLANDSSHAAMIERRIAELEQRYGS